MKDLQIFSSPQFGQVRIVTDESNQPWFCLADLCSILELHSNVVRQRLEDDVCSTYPISDNLGRTQQANFVNEDGLYDVILDSRKPEARKFRKWITSEVLPSIRATGSYSVAGVEWGTPVLQMLRTMETQVSQLLTTQKEVCQLRNDLDELFADHYRPKAEEGLPILDLSKLNEQKGGNK